MYPKTQNRVHVGVDMYPKTANRVHVFWGISGKTMGEGHRNKNIKKQPFGDASASHLSLVLWYV